MGYTLETLAYLALIALAAVVAIGSVGVSLGYSNMLPLALPGSVPGSNLAAQVIIAATSLCYSHSSQPPEAKVGYKVVAITSNNWNRRNFRR